MESEKIIVVHNGALGDFLSAWPAIYALTRHYNPAQQKSNNVQASPEFVFAGKRAWLPWLLPLGFKAAEPAIQQAIDSLYIAAKWPGELEHAKIFWFCLQAPPLELRHPNLVFLPALDFGAERAGSASSGASVEGTYFQESLAAKQSMSGVMQNLRFHLRACLGSTVWPLGETGEPGKAGQSWHQAWQEFFGGWGQGAGPQSREIGLVPGAGHRKKQWPLPCFEEVASILKEQGFSPVFLFGPAEEERGLHLSKAGQDAFRAECPTPAQALGQRLLQLRLIIACDGGPAHLAAMHGVPGLVLFGPTRHDVWAPPGLKVILPDWSNVEPGLRAKYQQPLCDPKEIDPNLASSLDLISPQQVLQASLPLLGAPCGPLSFGKSF